MAVSLSVSQSLAVSFNAVLQKKRKPANQWSENSYMRELEKQGGIKRESLGYQIERVIDYQRNPGTQVQPTDLTPLSLSKTEVLSSVLYDIAEVTAPMVWSKKDEVMNTTPQQKAVLVTSIASNGIESHDDIVEQAMFAAAATNGLLSLPLMMPNAQTGSIGGVDAGTNTFWRPQASTYVDDTDIESAFTTVWNACAKGSGSSFLPTLMVSDGATQALFEGTQQAQQRYVDTDELKAGFKVLAFKTARYVFSQYGTTSVYFQNPKVLYLVVSKEKFRDMGETQEIPNANGYIRKLYSAMQLVTENRSRIGVAHL